MFVALFVTNTGQTEVVKEAMAVLAAVERVAPRKPTLTYHVAYPNWLAAIVRQNMRTTMHKT